MSRTLVVSRRISQNRNSSSRCVVKGNGEAVNSSTACFKMLRCFDSSTIYQKHLTWEPLLDHLLVHNLGSLPGQIWNRLPIHRRQGKMEEGGWHPRLVGGRFNKQGKLHMRTVLSDCKISRFPHPPSRIFKLSIEALTGFGYIFRARKQQLGVSLKT